MSENEILGFNPTQLEVFQQNEMDYYNDSIEKVMKELHIEHCYKDKVFKQSLPISIYLAGKIEKNGWREEIVGYRCGEMYGGDYTKKELAEHDIRYKNGIFITGPWFLACDHGCYHGDNTHGLGINKPGDPEAFGDNYSEKEVYNICLKQIKRSDIIFAYINDETCYGSIYEIAWAKAHNKKIVIIFNNEKLMSDMWFMCQGANIVDVLGDKTVNEKFDEILEKISD